MKNNTYSVLFLTEGFTEQEFYKIIISKYIPPRKIRISKFNLLGQSNINRKVIGRINQHLDENPNENKLIVVIACDREGPPRKKPILNLNIIRNEVNKKRVYKLVEIIATQTIESWFYKDINGIYNFLRVPRKNRTKLNIPTFNLNDKDLAKLFRKHGKIYTKRGRHIIELISNLDLDLIYRETPEIKNAIEVISSKCSK